MKQTFNISTKHRIISVNKQEQNSKKYTENEVAEYCISVKKKTSVIIPYYEY
jgi:hypothetical protein